MRGTGEIRTMRGEEEGELGKMREEGGIREVVGGRENKGSPEGGLVELGRS